MSESIPNNFHISLHLGAHKTATTHLQQTLRANSELLGKARVAVCSPIQLRGRDESLSRRFGIHGRAKNDNGLTREQELGQLVGNAQRLVISEENLLGPSWYPTGEKRGPLYPYCDSRLEELIPCFGGRPLSLFFAVRNPADYLMSAYGQSLLGGGVETFEAFSKGLELSQLRWSNVIRRMTLVPNVTEIYVWRYEDYPSNHRKLMRKLVGWKLGVQVEPVPARIHGGLSGQAVDYVLKHGDLAANTAERMKLAHAARESFPTSDADPRYSPWKASEKKAAKKAYKKDFAEISTMEKVKIIRRPRARQKAKPE